MADSPNSSLSGAVVAVRDGVRLSLRVMPRSSRNEIGGVRDGRLIVRVTAPPVDHAATEAVIELLSRALDVPRRSIRLVTGLTSRSKTVEISGVTADRAQRALDRTT